MRETGIGGPWPAWWEKNMLPGQISTSGASQIGRNAGKVRTQGLMPAGSPACQIGRNARKTSKRFSCRDRPGWTNDPRILREAWRKSKSDGELRCAAASQTEFGYDSVSFFSSGTKLAWG